MECSRGFTALFQDKLKWETAYREGEILSLWKQNETDPHLILLTWQDNSCFRRASSLSLQTKLYFIKELIFPPQRYSRWGKVLYHRNWNCENESYLGDGLVLDIIEFTIKWNHIPERDSCVRLLEKHTIHLALCNYPIPNWKNRKCVHA